MSYRHVVTVEVELWTESCFGCTAAGDVEVDDTVKEDLQVTVSNITSTLSLSNGLDMSNHNTEVTVLAGFQIIYVIVVIKKIVQSIYDI